MLILRLKMVETEKPFCLLVYCSLCCLTRAMASSYNRLLPVRITVSEFIAYNNNKEKSAKWDDLTYIYLHFAASTGILRSHN